MRPEHLHYWCQRRNATTTTKNVQAISSMTINAKCLNNILENIIEEWIKWVIHYDKTVFIRGMKGQFYSGKSTYILITLKIKGKKSQPSSIGGQKTSDKGQATNAKGNLKQNRNRRKLLIIKRSPQINIILTGKKYIFHLKSGIRQASL